MSMKAVKIIDAICIVSHNASSSESGYLFRYVGSKPPYKWVSLTGISKRLSNEKKEENNTYHFSYSSCGN